MKDTKKEVVQKNNEIKPAAINTSRGIGKPDNQSTGDSMTSMQLQIMDVIDEITDKINLLTLNAALECNRTGRDNSCLEPVIKEISRLTNCIYDASKQINDTVADNPENEHDNDFWIDHNLQKKNIVLLNEIFTSIESVQEKICQLYNTDKNNEQEKETANLKNDTPGINRVKGETEESTDQTSSTVEQIGTRVLELKNLVSNFKKD